MNVSNYKEKLKGLCLVEVSGGGCANCCSMMPILSGLTAHMPQLTFVHLPLEENGFLAEQWNIDRVPTIVLTQDGEPFAKCAGYQPEEILEVWIEAKLEEHNKEK